MERKEKRTNYQLSRQCRWIQIPEHVFLQLMPTLQQPVLHHFCPESNHLKVVLIRKRKVVITFVALERPLHALHFLQNLL